MNRLIRVIFIIFLTNASSQRIPAAQPAEQDRVSKVENQLAVIKDYNDDFLSIILWSLGTVASMALVLVGFNWYQATRTLHRELETMKIELRSQTDARFSELDRLLRAQHSQEISDLKKVTLEATANASRQQIAALSDRVGLLEWRRIKQETMHWLESNPVPANAFSTSVELLQKAMALQNDYLVSESFALLEKSLAALDSKHQKLAAIDLSDLERTLEGLGRSHQSTRAAILKMVERLQSV